ncbi:cysteine hydrolase family protein [Actinoplanes sp. NPDC051859]|uniref:cysteine hydrolase family protein n=1 Tax=Actinoplanes sp. NPDC051859 TaxID=3363909 RepID=UPI0037BBD23F
MGKQATVLEIDWQVWIAERAHDATAAEQGRQVRSLARTHGWPVLCCRYLSADLSDRARADPNSPAAAFLAGLGPGPDDAVITKHGRDAFDVPDLPNLLGRLNTGRLVLTGLMTEHGVALAARSAAARGWAVTVVADACAATSSAAHEKALADLREAGVEVVTAADLPASIASAEPAALIAGADRAAS